MFGDRGFHRAASILPGSGRRFPTAAAMSAGLTALGVGALLASAQTTTPTATEACAASTPASGAAASELCVGIGEFDIYYKPNLVTIPADEAVTIQLHNQGVIEHNFSITDHENAGVKNLDITVNIAPGTTEETSINAPEGEYYFFCDVPGHEAAGMRGYITVKKDGTIETSEATVTPHAD